ncbi:MAG: sigma 54-interacting transcriptional regulator [bacterium]|nr:sigma 54-interacting transcriptional regulator [bacterium]
MSILFIAPSAEMARTARKVFADETDQMEIVEALLSTALPVARRAQTGGVDTIVITRGGTALLLKKAGIMAPIVEIPIAAEDMVQAVAEACQLAGKDDPRIGVVAFPNMTLGLEAFAPLLRIDLRYYPLELEEDVHQALDLALADGVEVVLGGVITSKVAEERGIPAVLLQCGPNSFRLAVQEAQRIVDARWLEKQQAEEFKAILDYAHEGIVAINREGRITVFNPVTERLTGVHAGDALGRPARDVIPEARLTEALASGRQELSEMVSLGKTDMLVSRVPIMVDGQIMGVVGTLQDVTRIIRAESKIRQEANRKGHVARFRFSDLRGESPALMEAVRLAKGYSATDSAILLQGETGVGKEIFAQSIHHESGRSKGPFVAVNCAALPESLLESELFGYAEGAFTGARKGGKPGLFELAHGGTLLLDEVSEIPLSLQGRLLRVLQEREVMRLGHDRVIKVDVRVICATNRDLDRHVKDGHFRVDLFYRLNVLSLRIPSLRERPVDVPVLVDHFLVRQGGEPPHLSEGAMELLMSHPWPGNVRELENWCHRLMVTADHGKEVGTQTAARLLESSQRQTPSRDRSTPEEIQRALRQAGGNLHRAAEILGIHRVTLWRRLKKTGQQN